MRSPQEPGLFLTLKIMDQNYIKLSIHERINRKAMLRHYDVSNIIMMHIKYEGINSLLMSHYVR